MAEAIHRGRKPSGKDPSDCECPECEDCGLCGVVLKGGKCQDCERNSDGIEK